MNWDAVSAISGLLGALGVIITLIYLSAQIKQNNNQLRGAATTVMSLSSLHLRKGTFVCLSFNK